MHSRFIPILFLAALPLGFFACSHQPISLGGAKENFTPTAVYQDADPNHVVYAMVGMNDFHGNLMPRERKLVDGRVIKSGGAAILATVVKILKQEMQGRLFIVDAGDEWQGTLESNQVQGASVVEFYNQLGVSAAAIGNHEFDFGLEPMRKRFSEAHYPYVASNIFQKKTAHAPRWKNMYPSTLVSLDGYKIGVIGFSTTETPGKTRYSTVKDLEFRDPVNAVMEQAKKLRKRGANAMIVTAHAGTECENGKSEEAVLKEWRIRDESTPETKCKEDQEIYRLAAELPANTLDAIVAGHTHQVMHHWINHVPIVMDEAYDQYINVIYFTFDRTTKKLIPSLTRIEGLIPLCTQFFTGTHTCDVRLIAKDAKPSLEPAYFHGRLVVPDATTETWLKPVVASTEKYRQEVLGETELPLGQIWAQESALKNLVADALQSEAKSDFSLVNSGAIRSPIDQGKITYDALYRSFPFDNLLNVLKLKGKDVRLLFQIATSGTRGIPGFSGLHLTLIPLNLPAPKVNLMGNAKLEDWETNRLISITLANGQPLQDEKWYTVATFDYLVGGGDDLHWFMSRIPAKNIDQSRAQYSRDLVVNYLMKHHEVNPKAHPLVDPAHPRVSYQ
jgi:5'-nucleotidase